MSAAKNFRVNLRTAMDDQNISQPELARRIGSSPSHVNGILQGRTEPTIGTCERLAAAVEMPLDLLILHPADFSAKKSAAVS